MTMLLLLLACNDSDANTKESVVDDYAHPLVPEQYRGLWDEDSYNCEDVVYYWAFEGSIDDAGQISGTESWYWFFADEGAATDCKDVFTVSGAEATTPVSDDPCFTCDRDMTATWTLTEQNCNWDGYENLFDNDDTDRIDEEVYQLALMLDADDGSGGLLDQMNVWAFVQDDQSSRSWNMRPISVGNYAPTGSDTRGAATVDWAIGDGACVDVTSGG